MSDASYRRGQDGFVGLLAARDMHTYLQCPPSFLPVPIAGSLLYARLYSCACLEYRRAHEETRSKIDDRECRRWRHTTGRLVQLEFRFSYLTFLSSYTSKLQVISALLTFAPRGRPRSYRRYIETRHLAKSYTMTIAPPSDNVRVAIIGAGASGISQIKQLLDAFERDDVKAKGKRLEVVCFEKGREVGGVWYVYEEKVKGRSKPYHSEVLPVQREGTGAEGLDKLVIWPKVYDEGDEPSAMYDGLRTNLPHVSYTTLENPELELT